MAKGFYVGTVIGLGLVLGVMARQDQESSPEIEPVQPPVIEQPDPATTDKVQQCKEQRRYQVGKLFCELLNIGETQVNPFIRSEATDPYPIDYIPNLGALSVGTEVITLQPSQTPTTA